MRPSKAQNALNKDELLEIITKRDTAALIRCEDEECEGVSFRHEIAQNNWKCPYCGMSISKPEQHLNSDVSLAP